MGADQLVDRFREHEVADLRANVDAFGFFAGNGVPEANGAISCSSA